MEHVIALEPPDRVGGRKARVRVAVGVGTGGAGRVVEHAAAGEQHAGRLRDGLGLRGVLPDRSQHGVHRRAAELAGAADDLDLGRALDHAELLHHAVGPDQLRVGQGVAEAEVGGGGHGAEADEAQAAPRQPGVPDRAGRGAGHVD